MRVADEQDKMRKKESNTWQLEASTTRSSLTKVICAQERRCSELDGIRSEIVLVSEDCATGGICARLVLAKGIRRSVDSRKDQGQHRRILKFFFCLIFSFHFFDFFCVFFKQILKFFSVLKVLKVFKILFLTFFYLLSFLISCFFVVFFVV